MAAIVGIPWLAAKLGGAFGALVGWFAAVATKRIALAAAAVVGLLALTATFVTAIQGLMVGISAASPANANLVAHFVPTNFAAALGVCTTAKVARWVYDWNVSIIQLRLFN